jgi:hypothetical protein
LKSARPTTSDGHGNDDGPRAVIRRPDNEPHLMTARWWGWATRWVVEEWRAGWRSATQWPQPQGGGLWNLATVTKLVVLFGIVAAALELSFEWMRDWTAARPVLVGIASALVVVTPAALSIERFIAAREARRWRHTAIGGIETYMWRANRFNDRFIKFLLDADDRVRKPSEEQALYPMLQRIAERAPAVYEQLFQIAGDEADANGHVALSAVPAMALYPPLASFVDRLWDIQQYLRDIQDECLAIAFLGAHQGTPKGEAARKIQLDSTKAIGDLSHRRQHALIDLRIDLEQLDEVDVPAVSMVQDLLYDAPADADGATSGGSAEA